MINPFPRKPSNSSSNNSEEVKDDTNELDEIFEVYKNQKVKLTPKDQFFVTEAKRRYAEFKEIINIKNKINRPLNCLPKTFKKNPNQEIQKDDENDPKNNNPEPLNKHKKKHNKNLRLNKLKKALKKKNNKKVNFLIDESYECPILKESEYDDIPIKYYLKEKLLKLSCIDNLNVPSLLSNTKKLMNNFELEKMTSDIILSIHDIVSEKSINEKKYEEFKIIDERTNKKLLPKNFKKNILYDFTPSMQVFNLYNYDGEKIITILKNVYENYKANIIFPEVIKSVERLKKTQEVKSKAKKYKEVNDSVKMFLLGMGKNLKDIYGNAKEESQIKDMMKNLKIKGDKTKLIDDNYNDKINKEYERFSKSKIVGNNEDFNDYKEKVGNDIINYQLKTFGKFSLKQLLQFWIAKQVELKNEYKFVSESKPKIVKKEIEIGNFIVGQKPISVTPYYEPPSDEIKRIIPFPANKFSMIKNDK